MADLFHSYWWLIFPLFGLYMAVWGTISSERQSKRVMDLLKSYVDHGKDPPPELLALASKSFEQSLEEAAGGSGKNDKAWTLVTFLGIGAGFGAGWWMVRGEDYAFAFAIVAVVMAMLSVGTLLIMLFGRK